MAYYDDEADLTWLADANFAHSTNYVGADRGNGRMTWQSAVGWAAQLNVNGVDGWRLPDTLQPDTSCDSQLANGLSVGTNCTGGELGNLFYNVLGGVADTPLFTTHNASYELFSNITNGSYWSATELASNTSLAWVFGMNNGSQGSVLKDVTLFGWAVKTGDVGTIPVPAAMWLFSSGLLGLIGIAKKRNGAVQNKLLTK